MIGKQDEKRIFDYTKERLDDEQARYGLTDTILFSRIKHILDEWDILDLLWHAPPDEYESEAECIFRCLKAKKGIDYVTNTLFFFFEDCFCFEINPNRTYKRQDYLDECKDVAAKILDIIAKDTLVESEKIKGRTNNQQCYPIDWESEKYRCPLVDNDVTGSLCFELRCMIFQLQIMPDIIKEYIDSDAETQGICRNCHRILADKPL